MFGAHIFVKDDGGAIFHTYSTHHRGAELLMGALNWLDLVPKGRNESAGTMSWVRLHDAYQTGLPSVNPVMVPGFRPGHHDARPPFANDAIPSSKLP